jgi:hypothetical protein
VIDSHTYNISDYPIDKLKPAILKPIQSKKRGIPITRQQMIGIIYYDLLHKSVSYQNIIKFKHQFQHVIDTYNTKYKTSYKIIISGSFIHNQIKSYDQIFEHLKITINKMDQLNPTPNTAKYNYGDIDIILCNTGKTNDIFDITYFISLIVKHKLLKCIINQSHNNENNYIENKSINISFLSQYGKTDLHIVAYDQLFYHLLYFGIGEIWTRQFRKNAKEKKYILNQYGLYKSNKLQKVSLEQLHSILYK